eukprot:gene5259-7308_t
MNEKKTSSPKPSTSKPINSRLRVSPSVSNDSNNENLPGSNPNSGNKKDVRSPAQRQDENMTPMSKRMAIMLKKELQKKQEEDNYTYKPKIIETKRVQQDGVSSDGSSRFDRLYSDALKRHLDVKVKADSYERPSFHPTISDSSRGRSRSREKGSKSGDKSVDSTSRSSSVDIATKLYNQHIGNVSAEVKAEYTPSFKPKISKRAKSLDRAPELNGSVTERLFNQTKTHKEKELKAAAEAKLREKEICTFKPKIKRSSSTGKMGVKDNDQMEVTERLLKFGELSKKKIEEAKKIKASNENKHLSFKPKIKTTSRSSTPNGTSVYERLSHPVEKNLSLITAEVEAEMTFQPRLVSKRTASPNGRGSIDVHERLFSLSEKHRDYRTESLEDDKELTFKPQISQFTKNIVDKLDSNPVFERLSVDNKAGLQEILNKIKMELELKDCTFKPTLIEPLKGNQISPSAKGEPAFVKLNKHAEYMRGDLEKKVQEKLVEEMKEATFAPALPAASVAMATRRNSRGIESGANGENNDTIYDRLYHQTLNHTELDKNIDDEELTFHPHIPDKSNRIVAAHRKPSKEGDVYDRLSQSNNHSRSESPAVRSDDEGKADQNNQVSVSVAKMRLNALAGGHDPHDIFARKKLVSPAVSSINLTAGIAAGEDDDYPSNEVNNIDLSNLRDSDNNVLSKSGDSFAIPTIYRMDSVDNVEIENMNNCFMEDSKHFKATNGVEHTKPENENDI